MTSGWRWTAGLLMGVIADQGFVITSAARGAMQQHGFADPVALALEVDFDVGAFHAVPWLLPRHPRLSIAIGAFGVGGATLMGALGSRPDHISSAVFAAGCGVGFLLAGAIHRVRRRDLR